MTANLPVVDPHKVLSPVLLIRGEHDGIASLDDLLDSRLMHGDYDNNFLRARQQVENDTGKAMADLQLTANRCGPRQGADRLDCEIPCRSSRCHRLSCSNDLGDFRS